MIGNLNKFIERLKPQYDDDVIDRLNYIHTVMILLSFAVTIGAKQYVGQPLQCWVPAQFKGAWEQYVENYCFVDNTYWVAMHDDLPTGYGEREQRELQYYQWVPFVLALQAMLFYMPRMVWKMLNWQSGLDVTALIQTAMQTKSENNRKVLKSVESSDIDNIQFHFQVALSSPTNEKVSRGLIARFLNLHRGIYVTTLYLITKLLNLLNVLFQLVILNWFLGPQYTWWGWQILADLANGRQWETSGHFPRVTMCDVEVRQLGNLHRWSVQCVLMINMFNEKIFLFLWWWFMLVTVLNLINLVYWTVISVNPGSGRGFVCKYFAYKNIEYTDKNELNTFVDEVLRKDGITVLRLISDNCGDLITAKIIAMVWKVHHKGEGKDSDIDSLSDDDDEKDRLMSTQKTLKRR